MRAGPVRDSAPGAPVAPAVDLGPAFPPPQALGEALRTVLHRIEAPSAERERWRCRVHGDDIATCVKSAHDGSEFVRAREGDGEPPIEGTTLSSRVAAIFSEARDRAARAQKRPEAALVFLSAVDPQGSPPVMLATDTKSAHAVLSHLSSEGCVVLALDQTGKPFATLADLAALVSVSELASSSSAPETEHETEEEEEEEEEPLSTETPR